MRPRNAVGARPVASVGVGVCCGVLASDAVNRQIAARPNGDVAAAV